MPFLGVIRTSRENLHTYPELGGLPSGHRTQKRLERKVEGERSLLPFPLSS